MRVLLNFSRYMLVPSRYLGYLTVVEAFFPLLFFICVGAIKVEIQEIPMAESVTERNISGCTACRAT